MANFCLPVDVASKFLDKVKDGSLNPAKLASMTSAERRAVFEKLVGPASAKDVNAEFESKLLLKNQSAGLVTWAKKVSGVSPQVRQDMITRIQKLDRVLDPADRTQFLKDLASTKLGVDVTQAEAKHIAELSKAVETAQSAMSSGGDRLAYGHAKVNLANYVNDLKVEAQKLHFSGGLRYPIKATVPALARIPGEAKAINASMDNSAIFRQGWKTLWTHPGVWQRNARKSFVDLARQFGGKPVIDETMADINSRPNAINGRYARAKVAVGNLEEAFPTTAPEKIPILGRMYKASEAAYTAFVQRSRADIFDKYIQAAERAGVNVDDKAQLEAIGKLVNSLTGRGSLGKLEPIGNTVNNVFFSPRFVISNINTVTHAVGFDMGGTKLTPFARKQAAKNLVKIVVATSGIIALANAIRPGSVQLDPRSSDFGKIKVGDTRFDITGGAASIMTLAARLSTLSSKSTTTGQVTKLNSGKFGAQTGVDVFNSFLDNKLSPAFGVLRDLAKGQDTGGNKATIKNELGNAFQPMGIQNIEQMHGDPNAANTLLTAIIDGLGISSNTYKASQKNWSQNPTKTQQAFKNAVTLAAFKKANSDYNTAVSQWEAKHGAAINKLAPADRQKALTKVNQQIEKQIMKKYNFTAPKSKSTPNPAIKSLVNTVSVADKQKYLPKGMTGAQYIQQEVNKTPAQVSHELGQDKPVTLQPLPKISRNELNAIQLHRESSNITGALRRLVHI